MTISQATKFLEDAFDALNQEYFENALPKPIIVIQSAPGINGHFYADDIWQDTLCKVRSYEISMGAEALKRPIANIIATLVHEMVHYYCHLQGIQDTSRGGTYHNSRFKDEAEKRALLIEYSPKIGHSITSPSPALKTFCTSQHWRNKLTIFRGGDLPDDTPKKKKPSSTRKYVCPSCGQSIRATKEVNIICGDCQQTMEVDA